MKKFLCILMCIAMLLTGTYVAFAENTKPVITENLPSYIYVDADKPEEKDGRKFYTVSLSLKAEGETELTYKWYYWNSCAETPDYEELNGFTAGTLTAAVIPYDTVIDYTNIYCEVSDLHGGKTISVKTKIIPVKEAKISVPEKIEFTKSDNENGAYRCKAKAVLKNTANDTPAKYCWYCKKSNGDIMPLGVSGDTLDISIKEDLILEGISFFCEVTLYSVAKSTSKEISVSLAPFFKEAPSGRGGLYDEYGTMTAYAYSTQELTYKWYMSKDKETWNELKDDDEYSGTQTNRLEALTTNEEFFGLWFRCEASDGKNTATSEAVHFSKPYIVITAQPEDKEAPFGGMATFTVEAQGVGLKYNWELYSPLTQTWSPTSVTGKKLAIKINSLTAYGYKFRCVISDGENETTSAEAGLIQSYEITKGDVNSDGEITAADARLALRASVGLETYESNSYEFTAADWNSDGEIRSDDARSILRKSVGLE